jgi:hypothetical protein
MQVNVQIDASRAIARLQAAGQAIAPARLHAVMGRAAFNLIVGHLRSRNQAPNRLGGRRTNYYSKAADATSMRHDETAATIAVSQVGFRLHYRGGTVVPVNRRALTIPIHAASHGRRASEFPGIFRVNPEGGSPDALLADKPVEGGPLRFLYVLKKSVTLRPDPSVLPDPADIRRSAVAAVERYLARQIPAGGGQP